MPRITKAQAQRAGHTLSVNFDVIPIETLQLGMIVEMEHGRRGVTNVINGSLLKSAKIALAHLQEFPDYYIELDKMEDKLKRKWHGKRKPSIFLK